MQLPEFRRAFRDGEAFTAEGLGRFTVSVRRIGRLNVPSGRIVATDPLVFYERRPFSRGVPPGRYPVLVSIAGLGHRRKRKDERIVAQLRFTRRAPVRWEMATLPGQNARTLTDDQFFGYPVDAGIGCFMDAAAAKALRKEMRKHDAYYEVMLEAKNEVYVPTRSWADFAIGDSGHNLVMFSSGLGDGAYPSFWGFDRADGLACLVTDFNILDRTVTQVDGPAARKDGPSTGRAPV